MAFYTTNFRQFSGKTLKIEEIYTSYRDGWTDDGTTKTHKSFKLFPVIEDRVIYGDDERAKVEGGKQEWREAVYNKEDGKMEFVKVGSKLDANWFSTYKKVFDIKVSLEAPMLVKRWATEGEGDETVDEVVIKAVGAGKIKQMLSMLTDFEPQMVMGKQKDGTPGLVPEFDYEDKAKDQLKGVSFSLKVTGTGLDTAYVYKNKPFVKSEGVSISDVPF